MHIKNSKAKFHFVTNSKNDKKAYISVLKIKHHFFKQIIFGAIHIVFGQLLRPPDTFFVGPSVFFAAS